MMDQASTPKQIVAAGYDRIAERYSEWTGTVLSGTRARAVAVLRERLPDGAAVLDLGCATGIPVAKALAERFAVTGVDISARQIELARQRVPEATFVHGDMTAFVLADGSFDAVIATYALTHVPRDEYPALFARIAGWLRPGGLFVASLSAGDDPGTIEDDWLGAPMFFSGDDVETGLRRVRDAEFEIVRADEMTEDEAGVPVTFLWVVARKPEAGS
jgi:ubiquinone/menaquinone biosynthesis C-methylase UbiE